LSKLRQALEANRKWAAQVSAKDPTFFSRLANAQNPELLWIGCSDSRLPPNQIIGTAPGEVFVHRNVGNVVVHTDMNCLSVLQYAIDVLKVKHIVVCGHYGCGGVMAAMGSAKLGLIDNWLRHIKDVYRDYRQELDAIDDPTERADRLCEIHVQEQAKNVCSTTIVQEAWRQGNPLTVHPWIYSLKDGLIHDLGVVLNTPDDLVPVYRMG
jgi:carbonic anhydrase